MSILKSSPENWSHSTNTSGSIVLNPKLSSHTFGYFYYYVVLKYSTWIWVYRKVKIKGRNKLSYIYYCISVKQPYTTVISTDEEKLVESDSKSDITGNGRNFNTKEQNKTREITKECSKLKVVYGLLRQIKFSRVSCWLCLTHAKHFCKLYVGAELEPADTVDFTEIAGVRRKEGDIWVQ